MPTGPLYKATQSISSKTLYPGMKRSSEVGNEFCEKTKKKNKSCPKREPFCYEPCASIILEGWDSTMSRLEATSGFDSYTDHPSGLFANSIMCVPKFFDKSSIYFYRRISYKDRKIAKPLSSGLEKYCDNYHNKVTRKWIKNALNLSSSKQQESYFYVGKKDETSFFGYFTIDAENNCTLNPKTCAGTLISPNDCTWGSSYELFQFNINGEPDRMKRMGKNNEYFPKGSYKTKEMQQVWRAADYNEEAVVMYWWYPDIFTFRHVTKSNDLIEIKFDAYDDDCIKRIESIRNPSKSEFNNGWTKKCDEDPSFISVNHKGKEITCTKPFALGRVGQS